MKEHAVRVPSPEKNPRRFPTDSLGPPSPFPHPSLTPKISFQTNQETSPILPVTEFTLDYGSDVIKTPSSPAITLAPHSVPQHASKQSTQATGTTSPRVTSPPAWTTQSGPKPTTPTQSKPTTHVSKSPFANHPSFQTETPSNSQSKPVSPVVNTSIVPKPQAVLTPPKTSQPTQFPPQSQPTQFGTQNTVGAPTPSLTSFPPTGAHLPVTQTATQPSTIQTKPTQFPPEKQTTGQPNSVQQSTPQTIPQHTSFPPVPVQTSAGKPTLSPITQTKPQPTPFPPTLSHTKSSQPPAKMTPHTTFPPVASRSPGDKPTQPPALQTKPQPTLPTQFPPTQTNPPTNQQTVGLTQTPSESSSTTQPSSHPVVSIKPKTPVEAPSQTHSSFLQPLRIELLDKSIQTPKKKPVPTTPILMTPNDEPQDMDVEESTSTSFFEF